MHFKVILCSFLTPTITMVMKDPLRHSQLGYKGLYVASPYQGTSVCELPHPTPPPQKILLLLISKVDVVLCGR
jgi:hypothetical protein